MATTLYPTANTAPYTPATVRGAWDQTSGHVARALDTGKAGGGTITFVQIAETNAAANFDVLLGRWISGPVAAQTFGGTFDLVLGVWESNAAADFAFHIHVYITQGDSDTPRGTLIADYVETTANEWPTTETGRALAAAQTVAAIAASDGDRIVIEIGYVALNAVGTSYSGSVRYGTTTGSNGDPAGDLTAGSTSVTTLAGSFTFSQTISWSANTVGRLSHEAAEISEDADAADGFLSHVSVEVDEDGDAGSPARGFLSHVAAEVIFDNTVDSTVQFTGVGTLSPIVESEFSPPIDLIRPVVIIEACFGVAPSGKLGYRNWVKEHTSVVAHWYLSDVRAQAEDQIFPNDAGIYSGSPVKGRGLLPEFGLSTQFDGTNDFVTVDYDNFGLGTDDPFTWTVLIRPRSVTSAAARCIHMSGTTGGYLGLNTAGQVVFGKNGGTQITVTQPIEAEGEYLIVARYNGTTASVHVYDLINVQTADDRKRGALLGTSGPTAVSIGPHGGSDAFIGKGGSLEFAGDIQALAVFSDDLSDSEMAEVLECCIWTDISGDVRAQVPIDISRGLQSDQPDARIAPVGTARFALNNAENNEGGTRSWYSPGHANCRSGFARGMPVRVSLGTEILGSSFQFLGSLQSIKPTSGIHNDRLTHCEARDWMEEAAKFNLKGIQTQEDVTADEVLELILSRMDNKPHEISFAAGTDVYPVALDNTNDEDAYAQTEFSKVVLSEMGLLYITGDGTLTFESRSTRSSLSTVAHTFDNEMSDSEPDASIEQVINRVRITVHPREVDAAATTTLFQSTQRIAFDHGVETRTFLQFRDPNQRSARFGGLDVVTPAPTTHYTLNTAEDGSGTNVTGDPNITVTFEISGSGVYAVVNNQYGLRVYMQLEVLGRGVYDFEPVTVIEENEDSINSIGVHEIHIDMPYQTLVPVAQAAALQILNTFQESATRLLSLSFPVRKEVKYMNAGIFGEISTRIAAMEEMSGVDGEFFINGVKISWRQDQNIVAEWTLAPADTQDYWVMDMSALDTETRLGF